VRALACAKVTSVVFMETNVTNIFTCYKDWLREWPKSYIDPLLNGQKVTLNGQKVTLTSENPRYQRAVAFIKIGKKLT